METYVLSCIIINDFYFLELIQRWQLRIHNKITKHNLDLVEILTVRLFCAKAKQKSKG